MADQSDLTVVKNLVGICCKRLDIGIRAEVVGEERIEPNLLRSQDAGRYLNITSPVRRKEFYYSRIALERILSRYPTGSGFLAVTKNVNYSSSGAPYLDGGPQISISHKRSISVVVSSSSHHVGIDLETVPPKVSSKLLGRVTNGAERLILERLTADEKMAAILIFSIKEAVFKSLAFLVEQAPATISQIAISELSSTKESEYQFAGEYDNNSFKGTACYAQGWISALSIVKCRPAPIE